MSQTTHKKRDVLIAAAFMVAMLALASSAFANTRNSIQPAHVYFGTVQAGQHPNKLVTLHNGTGVRQQIAGFRIAGSGGYVFTMPVNTRELSVAWEQHGLRTCQVGETLVPGGRCVLDVRVHTVRDGWWRSVLSVTYGSGLFNSAELRVHVVGGAGA